MVNKITTQQQLFQHHMDWKISIVSFFAVVSAICVIPFINIEEPDKAYVQQQTNMVQYVEMPTTNSIPNCQTNNQERGSGENLDWFKNSSQYIWDGWKIK